jgi:hypothetical protein
MIYVLDANTFIQAKRRFYAFDICPRYWASLVWHQRQGNLCSNVLAALAVGIMIGFPVWHWLFGLS